MPARRIPYGSDSKKSYGPGEILPPAGKYRDWMLKDLHATQRRVDT